MCRHFPPFILLLATFVHLCASQQIITAQQNIHSNPRLPADHPDHCHVSDDVRDEIAAYQPIVDRILGAIIGGPLAGDTWRSLNTFVGRFGARLAGSDNLENSIDYLVAELNTRGLENVHTEQAPVTHWVRGGYEAAFLSSADGSNQTLNILGLGSSVGTPRGGIIGPLLVVESFAEFEALDAAAVKGHIVLFVPEWKGYGQTVQYRTRSASVAAAKGAVAALVRSMSPRTEGPPHTGQQTYADDVVRKIPVAALAVQDALHLLELFRDGGDRGKLSVRLEMEARNFPNTVMSRNTIAELQAGGEGARRVNESVVVVSGHLDSWDVGQGAMDDGGGAFVAWKAVEFLQKLGLRAKRTIRAIMWTGEEEGYLGGRQYVRDHAAGELKEFNFLMESDSGTFEPVGLAVTGNADAVCVMREIMKLMREPLNATGLVTPSDALSEVDLWANRGFPGASLETRNEKYFWYHHSADDTMAVELPDNLDKGAALFAAVAYVVADMGADMPRGKVTPL